MAADVMGECWVLPTTCPAISLDTRYRSCSGSTGVCLDLCRAIRANVSAYYYDTNCPV